MGTEILQGLDGNNVFGVHLSHCSTGEVSSLAFNPKGPQDNQLQRDTTYLGEDFFLLL